MTFIADRSERSADRLQSLRRHNHSRTRARARALLSPIGVAKVRAETMRIDYALGWTALIGYYAYLIVSLRPGGKTLSWIFAAMRASLSRVGQMFTRWAARKESKRIKSPIAE
jgi:predicted Co/Zn/Cd cation transporter (cation efflux family)